MKKKAAESKISQTRLRRLEKDAARYRFLKKTSVSSGIGVGIWRELNGRAIEWLFSDEVDNYVDKAMEKYENNKN